jgi:hypothetical protein
MAIDIRGSTIVDIGDKSYTITQLKASTAYRYLNKIKDQATLGNDMSADDIKELIVESTGISRDKYELEFCGKMGALLKLTQEIVEYNYADVFQEGVSEEV